MPINDYVCVNTTDEAGQYCGVKTVDHTPKEDLILISNGDGTFYQTSIADNVIPEEYKNFATGNFNGDGLTDFLAAKADDDGRVQGPNSSYMNKVYFSNGDGTFEMSFIPLADNIPDDHKVMGLGDFSGNGTTELYIVKSRTDGRADGISANKADLFWKPDEVHPDVITSITNGHGLKTDITYKLMTESSVYTKGSGASYPVQDQTGAGYVVAEVKADNGIGEQNTQSYHYYHLREHLNGLGSLGFEKMTVTDEATGIVTESTYSQDWAKHHQGLLARERTIAPSGVVMSDKSVAWEVRFIHSVGTEPRCFRFTPRTETVKRDLNGVFLSRVIEETTYDDFGFPTQLTMTAMNEDGSEAHSKATTNTYIHDETNWRLGQLTEASVTHQSTGQEDKTRTSSFTYTSDGLLESETIEPGHELSYTKTNTYNAFGAITDVTETWGLTNTDGIQETSRTTSFVYDDKVRYKLTETNPLGHAQTHTYHPLSGLVASTTGPNGLTTSFEYDAFGRKRKEIRADGSETFTFLEPCGGDFICPAGAAFHTRVAG